MPFGPFYQGLDPFFQGNPPYISDSPKKEKKSFFFHLAKCHFSSWGFHISIQKFQSKPLDGQKMPFGPFLHAFGNENSIITSLKHFLNFFLSHFLSKIEKNHTVTLRYFRNN